MVKEDMVKMIVEKLMNMSAEYFCEITGLDVENSENYESYEKRIAHTFSEYTIEELFDILVSIKSGDIIEYDGELTYVVYYYKQAKAADLIVKHKEGFELKSYVNFSNKNVTHFYGHSKIDNLNKLFEGVGADGSFGIF